MKRILLFISSLLLFLCFNSNVYAEINYDYEFKIINRDYSVLPFDNYYEPGEVASYNSSQNYVKIYGTNSNLVNPPRYLYLIYCSTSEIDFATTNVAYGNLSNNGSVLGSTCSVQGYTGNYYLNRWTVKQWSDLSDSGVYQFGIGWSITITNNLSYTIFANFQSFFLSNELITDFSNNYLLSEILSQNASLKSSLNDIQSSTDDTNNKLDETNDHLSDINDSLNDSDTSSATNEAGDFFSGFETNTFGLTSIITAPLELIASITSSTCSPLALQVPFVEDTTLNLPCMSTIYEQHFGSLLSVYQTITFGIIAYWVCVRIFALVKDFKNPDHDEIEVLDL